jgi:Tfp pilus assembly protein PilO
MTWRRVAAAVAIFLGLEVAAFALFVDRMSDQVDTATAELERATNDYLQKKRIAVNLDAYRQQGRELDETRAGCVSRSW